MESTPTPTSGKVTELWTVKAGNKEFQLSGTQMDQLKGKMSTGDLGYVDFGDFGIKISQISSWWLESRKINNQLPAHIDEGPTEVERKKSRVKVEQIRQAMKVKGII